MTAKQLKRTGTLVLAFCATVILALLGNKCPIANLSALSQTTTPVTSKLTFTITGGATVTLYRADSNCGGAASFTQIANLTTGGYTDTQPADGKTHCYYAMLPGNVPTNELEWTTPTPGTVTSKDASQDLTGTVTQ